MDESTNKVLKDVTELLLEETDNMIELFGYLEEARIKGKKGSKTAKKIYKKFDANTDSEAEMFGLIELIKDNMKGSMAQEKNEKSDEPDDDSPF